MQHIIYILCMCLPFTSTLTTVRAQQNNVSFSPSIAIYHQGNVDVPDTTLVSKMLPTSELNINTSQTPIAAFKAGESLHYTMYYNLSFIWIKGGQADLKTTDTIYNGQPMYRAHLASYSKTVGKSLWTLRDTMVAIIDHNLRPFYYKKIVNEGHNHYTDIIKYAYQPLYTRPSDTLLTSTSEDSLVTIRQTRIYQNSDTPKAPYHGEYKDTAEVYDMLSFFMFARSFTASKFKINEEFQFKMVSGKHVKNKTIVYKGRKNIRLKNKEKYKCLVFSFIETKHNRKKEIVRFYISDDHNHFPLQVNFYLSFGSAKVFMDSVENAKYPISSKL